MSGHGPDQNLSGLFPSQLRPIDRLIRPIRDFGRHQLAGTGLLMLATIAAIIWANSPWEHDYNHLLHQEVGMTWGHNLFSKSLHHWINDGLMGMFFFLVGLEIKREVLVGELSTVRKATLPAVAALGGMVAPALIFFALNSGAPESAGWGIPMATDIAFALGVMALLGDRVPLGLKVFLTALAIVDDIGAVLVIALFYTDTIATVTLLAGLGFVGISMLMNKMQVRNAVAFLIVGILCWLCFLQSGVHATIAALLMAFTIPARTRIDGKDLSSRLDTLLDKLKSVGLPKDTQMNDANQQQILERMGIELEKATAPLQELEHAIAPPVTFLVLPIFALANAGVTVHGGLVDSLTDSVSLGIICGLVFGKPIGITLASWIAVKFGIADLPRGVTWKQIIGTGFLAGIGFTMALFVGGLAYKVDPELLETSKVGIMAASVLAGFIGFFLVRSTLSKDPKQSK